MPSDYLPSVNVYKIYRETMNRLASLHSHASEGNRLDEALAFARFVLWSGIVDLCNFHATESPLKISGANLQTSAKQLQEKVQDCYRKNNLKPAIEMSELQRLNHKLDLIAGRLSRISPPLNGETADTGFSAMPELRVIAGGVS